MHQKTTLVRANLAFRDHNFDAAAVLYKEAFIKAEEPLKSRIGFNLKLTLHRLGVEDPIVDLVKPEGMEPYYFELIKQSGLFDPVWYVSQYQKKHGVGDNPLAHYMAKGVELSTKPSPDFDTAYYLRSNQDVANSGIHPFLHYITQGHTESRSPVPPPADNGLNAYHVEPPRYVPRLELSAAPPKPAARVIAFYLPQFHPIPENDKWWGEGFTEWSNVRPAQPQFEGHYQPHVPDEFLGYYDLRDTAVMRKQIELARQYGVEGFCFYTYWFSGHRLLETPVDNYLADPTLDLPFCICWANENWSRRWDGLDQDLLMVQNYSAEDDIAFISHMSKYLRDPRYIQVDGKPLLIVYRPNLFPSMKETAARWRKWCRNNGLGELYIAYVQSFEKLDPKNYGLDAAIEFPPNNSAPEEIATTERVKSAGFTGKIYDWRTFVKRSENYVSESYAHFRGVCPSWDNTPRKKMNGNVFKNSSPALFKRWLINAFQDTRKRTLSFDQRLVFVNAWNEWAEGAHLEPDQRFGYAWLQAIRDAHIEALDETQKHHSIFEARWNTIDFLFNTPVDKDKYAFLADYVSLFKQGRRYGAEYNFKDGVPKCELKGNCFSLEKREFISKISRKIYNSGPYCFVVLQYNNSGFTIDCVKSIQNIESHGCDIKIIIVDNGSEPVHVEVIKREFEKNTDVEIIVSNENRGFSAGNNIGYRYARNRLNANFCVVVNNDTKFNQANFIEISLNLFDRFAYSLAGPDIVIGDGRHENPWNDYLYSIEEFKSLKAVRENEREYYKRKRHATFVKQGRSTATCEIIFNPLLQGAAFVVSPIFMADHEELFDERLFLYGEEFLLATECLINGDLPIYSNQLLIEHHEGASTSALPSNQKIMLGYDSAIKSIQLCLNRLERKGLAIIGEPIAKGDHELIRDIVGSGGKHIIIDLFFCQPGYHGGGEYGKAVFKRLVEEYAERGGFELWAAFNPDLFIDDWVRELCKIHGVNIVTVTSYSEIVNLVNADIFSTFFTPAIVVYTGYEYMKKIGTRLPFTCKYTRVIGTLHDVRDFELSYNYERILNSRKNIGCEYEKQLSSEELERIVEEKRAHAEQLREMYVNIISDPNVRVVTISKYCEDSIYRNVGVPANPIKVLMSPMKPRSEPVSPDLHALGIGNSKFALILHAQRLEKNAYSAIKAFDLLFSQNPSARSLKVIITGVVNSYVESLPFKIEFQNNFICIGELMPENLEYFLKNAEFLVYPSFNEGLGYPPIEAMYYGTKCAVSNVTAIPEVCGNAVQYFDPYDFNSIYTTLNELISGSNISSDQVRFQYLKIKSKQDIDLLELINYIKG